MGYNSQLKCMKVGLVGMIQFSQILTANGYYIQYPVRRYKGLHKSQQ